MLALSNIHDLNPLFLSIKEEKQERENIHLGDEEFSKQELSWLVSTA